MKKISSEQIGRSMIEAIGYISIGIMLSVSVATAVNSGYFRFRLGRIHQELMDLKKVISQRYVAAENYNEVNFQTLIDEKILPHEIKNGKHSFGGEISIGPGDNGETFYIQFSSLPPQACTELGSRLWVVNDGSDLDSMEITSKVWAWEYSTSVASGTTVDYKLPAKPGDVAAECNPICTDDEGKIIECPNNDNYIKWYFN